MKLLRYGAVGAEKPGLLDKDGNIRDLSQHVPDIAGAVLTPDGLARLKAIDPTRLPKVDGPVRYGACVARSASSSASASIIRTMPRKPAPSRPRNRSCS